MKRVLVCVLVFLMLMSLSVSAAEGPAAEEEEVALLVRTIVARADGDPGRVAKDLAQQGIRFLGYQKRSVTFAFDGKAVHPIQGRSTSMGADLTPVTKEPAPLTDSWILAAQKADLDVTLWFYEWRRSDGTYREQLIVNGYWDSTENAWMDDPADVIDVRWIVGDLVYLSSTPLDGVQRDQHTHGIASFTVDDQIACWDLIVNFRPVSSDVHGRYSNIFVNYHHTWLGAKLTIQLGAGPTGSTGNITITTDASSWTEGSGFAFQIGSGKGHDPVTFVSPE